MHIAFLRLTGIILHKKTSLAKQKFPLHLRTGQADTLAKSEQLSTALFPYTNTIQIAKVSHALIFLFENLKNFPKTW